MENNVNLFYKNLKSFLKDLIAVFPEDEEILIITSSINIFSMDDDLHLINKFYTSLSPLESLINNRDNSFFLMEHSFNKSILKLFNKLNFCWVQLSETNQKIVWDYIQVIYNLSKDFNLNK